MRSAIVIGANSSIAQCVIEQLMADFAVAKVVAISRCANPSLQSRFGPRLQWMVCDYGEEAIASVCTQLRSQRSDYSHVVICNGVLHSDRIAPEKRFEDISAHSFAAIFQANTIVPMLWLAHLAPLLKSKLACSVAVFSARVGSIEDNRSGGWYSYRASKAALNMLVKTASIELKRRAPNVRLMLFHPGTTDTALSRPFQAKVPEGKLFTPAFVASSLLATMSKLKPDTGVEFLDWAGKPIAW